MPWPTFFPNGCPPEDSVDASGPVIRMVANDPPLLEDFKSHKELGQIRETGDLVDACGLSVMVDKEDVPRWRKRYPRLSNTRLKHAATGVLEPRHGKIMPTPSSTSESHHTWWVYDKVDPSPDFTILKGV